MFNRMVEYTQESLNRVFSAVADPTRRAILQGLAKNPATITEIAKPFPVSLNAVSKHVMVLERAGLVSREIQGREHLCTLQPHPLRDATAWLDHYRQFWEVRLDALERYVAQKVKGGMKKGAARGRAH
jgi:DNA-binding transcriptional ArsR family regulator